MKKSAVTKLLDEIEKIIEKRGLTVADLARDIGKSYHQTFMWVRSRRFNPRADALMILQDWRDKHKISREVKASAQLATTE